MMENIVNTSTKHVIQLDMPHFIIHGKTVLWTSGLQQYKIEIPQSLLCP